MSKIKKVKMRDVVGLKEAKKKIKQSIDVFFNDRLQKIYQKGGIKRPRGILMYGASNVGKTTLMYAIRWKYRKHFKTFMEESSNLITSSQGATRRAVMKLAHRIERSKKPVLLFLDELDAIIPKRGSTSPVFEIRTSEVLKFLSGVSEGKLYIIAATNRPYSVDQALLKNSARITDWVYAKPPNFKERKQLINKYIISLFKEEGMGNIPLKNSKGENDKLENHIDSMAKHTKGRTGGDFEHIGGEIIRKYTSNVEKGKDYLTIKNVIDIVDDYPRLLEMNMLQIKKFRAEYSHENE